MTPGLRSLMRLLPRPLLERALEWQWRGRIPAWAIRLVRRSFRDADQTIRHGAGRGLRFNPGRANVAYALGISEPAVQEALARLLRPGDTFYDIGANVGLFTVIGARLVGPGGDVLAFEPHPETARALRHNVALNAFTQVTVIEAAAWREQGRTDLVVRGEPTSARLADVQGRGGAESSVPVRLVAIDDLVREGVVRPPAVVKMDIEGAEIEALQGMARTLDDWRPTVICEMHDRNAEFGALMRAHGYTLTVLEEAAPVETAHWDVHAVAVHPAGPAARPAAAALP